MIPNFLLFLDLVGLEATPLTLVLELLEVLKVKELMLEVVLELRELHEEDIKKEVDDKTVEEVVEQEPDSRRGYLGMDDSAPRKSNWKTSNKAGCAVLNMKSWCKV